jgi:hypothetical protein
VKKTFMTLLVSAVAVWGYVIVQIIFVLIGRADDAARGRGDGSLPSLAMISRSRVPLDTGFRDPFQSYLYAQKPAPIAPKPSAVKAAPAVAIEPPQAVLSGILWGDEPVAILKQNGRTELVKKGADIWGMKVVRIDHDQVVVRKQGRQFTLGY